MTRFAKMPPGPLDREGFLARYAAGYAHSPALAGAVVAGGAAPGRVGARAGAWVQRLAWQRVQLGVAEGGLVGVPRRVEDVAVRWTPGEDLFGGGRHG